MRIRFIISVGFVCTVSGIDKMTVPLSVNKKILYDIFRHLVEKNAFL